MFFCKNCSSLLDDDLPVCPNCGAEDENADPGTYDNPNPAPASKTLADTIDRINSMIDNNEQTDVRQPFEEQPKDGAYDINPPPYPQFAPEERDIPVAIRAGLIILSLLVPICGIVFGAIYRGKDSAKEKKFGSVLLIIGLILIAFNFLCCCTGNSVFSSVFNNFF